MRDALGSSYADFHYHITESEPVVSIRFNPSKSFQNHAFDEVIPWHPDGRYLPERPVFALDPMWHAGAYYVQEASSMLVAEAFRQVIPGQHPLKVLDLCAAPGGKTTLLLDLLPSGSTLVSNEVIKPRFSILEENIWRWGNPGIILTRQDPAAFEPFSGYFDVVLVDAPCSGEGLFRKDPASMEHWSEDHVNFCADRQKRILSAATSLLAPGGVLLYSTCTFSKSENIDNAEWIRKQSSLESLELSIPSDWGVQTVHQNGTFGYQCYPHLVRGEGFFLACLKNQKDAVAWKAPRSKGERMNSLPKNLSDVFRPWLHAPDDLFLHEGFRGDIRAFPRGMTDVVRDFQISGALFRSGLPIGQLKGRDVIPSAGLALSPTLRSEKIPTVALSREDALTVLRKEASNPTIFPKGWSLATFENQGLAWMKGLGNRVNNGYPKAWRLRK